MTQALYTTWRPATWEGVIGQDHIVRTLRNAISTDRVGHAYLFAGPKGTGKTTSARLLAKAVNCLDDDPSNRPCNHCANCLAVNEGRFLDLIEIDAASNTSVEDIRELRDRVGFSPSQGRFKVYIIDEVHMLSTSAFNALLKTLEEPPSHVIFILATTEIHKIPATVLSRCQRHEFRRIPLAEIIAKLKEICAREAIQIDEESLSVIARQATGSMRDAISLLDQLSSLTRQIDLAITQEVLGTATNQAVIDLVESIRNQSAAEGFQIIQKTLDAGADPRQFARQTADYLRNMLVLKLDAGKDLELLPEVRARLSEQVQTFSSARLIDLINAFSDAANSLKASWQPSLGLELAYAGALADETPPAPVAARPSEPASVAPARPAASHSAGGAAPKSSQPPANKPTPEFSLQGVRQEWDALKRALRTQNTLAGALFNSARLVSVNGDTVTLNTASQLLRDRLLEEKNLKLLQKVFNDTFGREIQIVCTFGQTIDQSSAENVEPGSLADRAIRELHGVLHVPNPNEKEEE
jgi:DNA polymerase-3 subunit gamma/tau